MKMIASRELSSRPGEVWKSLLFVRPLHDGGVRYLIGGSLAAMHYSEPRYTIDVDLALLITPGDAEIITRGFAAPEFRYDRPPITGIFTKFAC